MTDTFTLTQTAVTANLFIYPMSDVAGQCALAIYPTSPVTHYDKVDDDQGSPDDDATFVYCAVAPPAIVDMYNLTNHTTESGTINYVKIISRARSDPLAQSPSGEYKHKIICGTGTGLSTNYAPLGLSYQTYSTIWNLSPASGIAWTWAEIDALTAGLSKSSPVVTGSPINAAYRPNGVGFLTDIPFVNPAIAHWDAVNEVVLDLTDYVYNQQTGSYAFKNDLYTIPAHTTESGVINYIRICAAVEGTPYSSGSALGVHLGLKYSTFTQRWGTNIYPGGGVNYVTNDWATNLDTSAAWTWSDIDLLQIGVGLNGLSYNISARCYWLYMLVNYIPNISPQIRTTMLYAIVNYNPSAGIVTLISPNKVRFENTRKTNRFIFPDGTYCIGDYGRGSKKMTLTGTETVTAIAKMRQVQAMVDNPSPITISGLSDVSQDTTWRLSDFDFDYDPTGDHYDWTAEFTSYDSTG